jgi:hypothetical protein
MQELDSSIVHRHLDTKLKIGGVESLDLLLTLTLSAVMGFFFDGGILGIIFILIIPMLFLGFLVLVKRNKPEGYLKDIFRFSNSRGFYSASESIRNEAKIRQHVSYKANHFHG